MTHAGHLIKAAMALHPPLRRGADEIKQQIRTSLMNLKQKGKGIATLVGIL